MRNKVLITALVLLVSGASAFAATILTKTSLGTITGDDVIYIVNDPLGTPTDHYLSLSLLAPALYGLGGATFDGDVTADNFMATSATNPTITWTSGDMEIDGSNALSSVHISSDGDMTVDGTLTIGGTESFVTMVSPDTTCYKCTVDNAGNFGCASAASSLCAP